jgi:hypothetical protein
MALEVSHPGMNYVSATVPMTMEQWKAAWEISQHQFEVVRPSLQRRAAVDAEFAKQCEAGQLLTFYRATEGGEMHPIPRAWWNTEKSSRFIMCQLSPTKPFSTAFAGESFAWIFVSRESLDRYLNGQPFAKAIAGVDVHLSPYLKLMLSVAAQLQITPDNQPKKEELIEVLRSKWTGSQKLSANLVDAMSTLIREPESQLGRARKIRRAER